MDNKKMNMPYAGENMKPVANMPMYQHHHGHHCGGYGGGYGCGFTIIVVLFILLVIIGATVYCKEDDC
jgi:uncharacterized protein (TIGR01732 family)